MKWKYENDDWEMRDAGLEYSRIIQIPVEMIEIDVWFSDVEILIL